MIRKNLLIHSITYYKWLGNDGRGETYDTGVTVNNVRLEPISKVINTAGGEEWIAKTLLFYDFTHSTGVDIIENSKIEFTTPQGKVETYYIKQIDILYTRRKHHMEVYCA